MSLQYIYHNSCSHAGIGPIINTSTAIITSPRPYILPSQVIPVHVSFPCPFCASPPQTTKNGVLAFLSSATGPFPDMWRVFKLCDFEELTDGDWEVGGQRGEREGGQGIRHVAWIARPVGVVEVAEEGVRRVSVRWRRTHGRKTTMFEGLLQRLREDGGLEGLSSSATC